MHLTLRQLRYFVEIARCGGLSPAARRLAVAQPALSQNLAALEDALGQQLVRRHARGVALTPAGQRLYERASALLAEVDGLPADLRGEPAQPSGPVRLAIAGSLAGVLVAPLLRAVAEQHPGIALSVSEGMSSEIRRQVESGQAQLALMPNPGEWQGMAAQPLFEEQLLLCERPADRPRATAPATAPASAVNPPNARVAVIPPGHPHPRRRPVSLAQALRGPLAAPDRTHDLRKLLERSAAALGQSLDIRHELNSPQMLVAVAREGLARAILPIGSSQDALAAGALVGRPIRDLKRVQALVWPQDRPPSPAGAAVAAHLTRVVAEQLQAGRLLGRWLASHRIG